MQARQLCPSRSPETQAPSSYPFLISWDVTFVPVIKMAARAPAIASEFQAPGWKREEEEGATGTPNCGLPLAFHLPMSWSARSYLHAKAIGK